jgi:hypothetical protein
MDSIDKRDSIDSRNDNASYDTFKVKSLAYATEVSNHLKCNQAMKRRIREDVIDALNVRAEELGLSDPVALMGSPAEVAADFSANLGLPVATGWEYESETKIFGLPLIHVVSNRMKIAKGIIAIGPVSCGVVSIGAVSVGLFSLGGIAMGLWAFGGVSIGFFMAMGGVAAAYDLAVGGFSIAKNMAVGGMAIAGDIAIGGQSIAQIAGHTQDPNVVSDSIEFVYRLPGEADQMVDRIKQVFPSLGIIKQWIVDLLLQ